MALASARGGTLTLSLETPAASASAASVSLVSASGGEALALRSRAVHRDAPRLGSHVPRGVAAPLAAALRYGTASR